MRVVLSIATALLLLSGVSSAQWVEVAKDAKSFTVDSKPFVVWGFNYDRDYRSRLIEDYWDKEWATVEQDFREMKGLGANAVRVHISVSRFMNSADEANEANLARLEKLARLAEEVGLYIDLTGLGSYRKEDVPAWYEKSDEAKRWAIQTRFWEAIAARLKDRPGVMAYDLMNEPIVPGSEQKEWLVGHLGEFWYCQFITREPGKRKREEIARQWVAAMSSAIRKHDQRHLITVGMLPGPISGFDPKVLGPELDYLSVHIYPDSKKPHEAMDEVKRVAAGGKPVVIEETYPLSCSTAELGQFIEQSRPMTAGYFGFYWGQTPEELRKSKGIGDAMTLSWLELFQKLAPSMNKGS